MGGGLQRGWPGRPGGVNTRTACGAWKARGRWRRQAGTLLLGLFPLGPRPRLGLGLLLLQALVLLPGPLLLDLPLLDHRVTKGTIRPVALSPLPCSRPLIAHRRR